MVTTHTTCFNNKKLAYCVQSVQMFSRDSQIRQRLLTQTASIDWCSYSVSWGRKWLYIYIYIKLQKQLRQRRNTKTALAEWNYGI